MFVRDKAKSLEPEIDLNWSLKASSSSFVGFAGSCAWQCGAKFSMVIEMMQKNSVSRLMLCSSIFGYVYS